MRRWERPLLLFSLALNVAFVSLAAVRIASDRSFERGVAGDANDRRVHGRASNGPFAKHWQARRAAALGRVLRLDPQQRARVDAQLETLRPRLREARQQAATQHLAFRRALARNDAGAVRIAATRAARAQAQLDSLSAEAMLQEIAVLEPGQRQRYVRWNFRAPRGPRPRLVD